MNVEKVYKMSMPPVKLVGMRFTDSDRGENGTFSQYWQQAFQDGWFAILEQCERAPGVRGDYIGAMRIIGDGPDSFEYWIGMFLSPDAVVPETFDSVEIPAGEVGVCWLYGSDKNGELFSMEASDLSMAAIKDQGWEFSEKGWFFERYNNPRFTEPDAAGNVILDICAYLI